MNSCFFCVMSRINGGGTYKMVHHCIKFHTLSLALTIAIKVLQKSPFVWITFSYQRLKFGIRGMIRFISGTYMYHPSDTAEFYNIKNHTICTQVGQYSTFGLHNYRYNNNYNKPQFIVFSLKTNFTLHHFYHNTCAD